MRPTELGADWKRLLVLAVAVLTVAASLCLFDADHDRAGDHVMPLDLCLGMLVASVAVPVVARLPQTGRAVAAMSAAAPAIVLSVPAPPPKLAL